jgi:ribosomal protein L7/L12
VGCAFTYALCHELDDILEKEGKEAYFVPKMKIGLERSGISDAAKIFLDKLGIKDTIPDKSSVNNYLLDQLNKLNNIDADKFKNDTGVSIEDAKKTIEYLNKNSNSVTKDVAEEIKNKNIFK